LVVEREPRDVDLTSALEDSGGDVEAAAVVTHHHVGGISPVEAFVGAGQVRFFFVFVLFCFVNCFYKNLVLPVVHEDVRLPQPMRWYAEVLDAAELGRIPPQVHVIPFLKRTP
jgi:hypothetical protein